MEGGAAEMMGSPEEEQKTRFTRRRRRVWSAISVEFRRATWPVANVLTPVVPLSPRESIIARHVAHGESHKVVAVTYSLSIQAVSTYLKRAKEKLGVRTHAELVRAFAGTTRSPRLAGIRHGTHVRTSKAGVSRRVDALTRAQRNVLAGLLRGQRHADIAVSLGITKRTVAAHVSAILRKVGASSRAELLAILLASPRAAPSVMSVC